jgi:predicted ATP-dependent endonuclease of OLD family
MKLSKVQITEFKSIRDSGEFEIGDITCLVGKNEVGKTALLQALYRLSPLVSSEGEFDPTDDYPRADVEDYRQDIEEGRRSPAQVVRVIYLIEDRPQAQNEISSHHLFTSSFNTGNRERTAENSRQ